MNNAQKLRKLHKFTQIEVAEKINYPKPLYVSFEHEKYILPDNKIKELASLYNVSVDYLMKDMPK